MILAKTGFDDFFELTAEVPFLTYKKEASRKAGLAHAARTQKASGSRHSKVPSGMHCRPLEVLELQSGDDVHALQLLWFVRQRGKCMGSIKQG